jgi:hypothetical protein
VREVVEAEKTWKIIFEHMGVPLLSGEKAELEFRKTLYKHKFDRQWFNEYQKIENEHYAVMGAIVEFTKPNTADQLKISPLDLPTVSTTYQFEVNLPFLQDISDELLSMLQQRFRQQYASEPTELDIKHQRLLDSIHVALSQNNFKSMKTVGGSST